MRAQEHVRGRRTAAAALALLGCVGLMVSVARAASWEVAEPSASGSCVVGAIRVDYDVDYVAAIGGYGVTAALLSDVPAACEGREVELTLRDDQDRAIAETSGDVTSPTTTLGFASGAAAAADVAGVSVALVTDEP
ncbi:MAG TPA: hypothetical protein VGC67_04880 [Cellulomonas sp.]